MIGVASKFNTGAFIDDFQYTYYKNLDNPGRPDMRIEHSIYFRGEVFDETIINKYCGGFTVYG